MSSIYDDLPQNPIPNRAWSGIIVSAPADFSDLVDVVIEDIAPEVKWEGCYWQARDAVNLPSANDLCLVIFDQNMRPWVVAWWPY